jgi:hypothetical protein
MSEVGVHVYHYFYHTYQQLRLFHKFMSTTNSQNKICHVSGKRSKVYSEKFRQCNTVKLSMYNTDTTLPHLPDKGSVLAIFHSAN